MVSRSSSLRLQVVPAPEIPGSASKAKGAPRKYQDWAIFLARVTRSREGWDSFGILSGRGLGFIAASFAAGIWIPLRRTTRVAATVSARSTRVTSFSCDESGRALGTSSQAQSPDLRPAWDLHPAMVVPRSRRVKRLVLGQPR